MLAEDLTQKQFTIISVLERTGSSLSILGALYILITYLCSSQFRRNAINRLMLYASVGNICTNIGTLISRSTISIHGTIKHRALCQFQGFLIQMFMPADAYWTLAMAVNVYMTFFYNYGERDLRRLEKWYFLVCYGVPLLPAVVYLCINTPDRGHMYGNATLWCWIASEWDDFRIITFYAPVWLAMILTIAMYTRAWKKIYSKYRQLQGFKGSRSQLESMPRDPFKVDVEPQVFVTQSVITESTAASGKPDANSNSSHTESKGYKIEISAGNEPGLTPPQHLVSNRKPSSPEANRAILSYTKVAATLFFFMFCTWVPSSANRVYSVINPGQILFPLECFSGLVLSLQGFWNAIIYAYTSRQAARALWSQIQDRLGNRAMAVKETYRSGRNHTGGGVKFYQESDSMAELQSRSGSVEGYSVEAHTGSVET